MRECLRASVLVGVCDGVRERERVNLSVVILLLDRHWVFLQSGQVVKCPFFVRAFFWNTFGNKKGDSATSSHEKEKKIYSSHLGLLGLKHQPTRNFTVKKSSTE